MRKRSNKTTLAGIITALGAALMTADQTIGLVLPDWVHLVALLLTVAGPVFLGHAARDHGISSEQAGAK